MKLSQQFKLALSVLLLLNGFNTIGAQELEPQPEPPTQPKQFEPTDLNKLNTMIRLIDEEAEQLGPNRWVFKVEERSLMVVADATADRMRIITPIIEQEYVDDELFKRMLQANFDSALDARYAVANDMVWGVFIHPLSDLSPRLFLSGSGQVYNVAESFGKTFSSGAILFNGGDSGGLQRDILEKLQELETQI